MTAEECQYAIDSVKQAEEAIQRALCALCTNDESIGTRMEQKLTYAAVLIEGWRTSIRRNWSSNDQRSSVDKRCFRQ
jgi:hypothetical protein